SRRTNRTETAATTARTCPTTTRGARPISGTADRHPDCATPNPAACRPAGARLAPGLTRARLSARWLASVGLSVFAAAGCKCETGSHQPYTPFGVATEVV